MQDTGGDSGGQCGPKEGVLLDKGVRNKKEVFSNNTEKQYGLTILDMKQSETKRDNS